MHIPWHIVPPADLVGSCALQHLSIIMFQVKLIGKQHYDTVCRRYIILQGSLRQIHPLSVSSPDIQHVELNVTMQKYRQEAKQIFSCSSSADPWQIADNT